MASPDLARIVPRAQDAVAGAGGIAPLVELLGRNDADASASAARALWGLSYNNPASQVAVSRALP